MACVPNFEVIVGTYEEFLLGYKIQTNEKDVELKQSFATHEHSSSLRTVTTSGKFLASGGADDRICVYDMIARKEHIMLTHHSSTVNCLQFTTGNTHLISSSIDGMLAITRVGNWVLEKMWEKVHKNGYIIAMAVHPTGKLLLTLGSDCSLQTWNLIKGRKAYIINLNSKSTDARSLSLIKWGPCGEKFILGGGENIEIWNITTGGILKKFNYKSKVSCATWLSKEVIVIGHENGTLTMLNIDTESSNEYKSYENRVKCLGFQGNFLVSASSSGCLKVWLIDDIELEEISICHTGCRVTCITLVDGLKVKKEEKPNEENNAVTQNNEKGPVQRINKQRIIIEEGSDDEDKIVDEQKVNKPSDIFNNNKNKRKNKRSKTRKSVNAPVINHEDTKQIITNNAQKTISSMDGTPDQSSKSKRRSRNKKRVSEEIKVEKNCCPTPKNKSYDNTTDNAKIISTKKRKFEVNQHEKNLIGKTVSQAWNVEEL